MHHFAPLLHSYTVQQVCVIGITLEIKKKYIEALEHASYSRFFVPNVDNTVTPYKGNGIASQCEFGLPQGYYNNCQYDYWIQMCRNGKLINHSKL